MDACVDKGAQMTCKDCIHYNVVTYPKGVTLPENDIARTHGKCDSLNMWVEPTSKCESFIVNDGSYESGSWHCHRCGKVVHECGLCSDCEKALCSWESVSK